MSTVDVVVPCYNYGRYLRACVDSILTQRDVDVRILIIDDMSNDSSEEVGRALAREDARVTYRRHTVNQGHIKTFNEGIIDWATADYTLLLSADDMLTPGALARAAQALNRHPEAGLVCGLGARRDPAAHSDMMWNRAGAASTSRTSTRSPRRNVSPVRSPTRAWRPSSWRK